MVREKNQPFLYIVCLGTENVVTLILQEIVIRKYQNLEQDWMEMNKNSSTELDCKIMNEPLLNYFYGQWKML